jgi:hypothetical protein
LLISEIAVATATGEMVESIGLSIFVRFALVDSMTSHGFSRSNITILVEIGDAPEKVQVLHPERGYVE